MILPTTISRQELEQEILRLERDFRLLDELLDYRQFNLVQLQLTYYYQVLMFENENQAVGQHLKQSKMNVESYNLNYEFSNPIS